jgi:hypothetical protein
MMQVMNEQTSAGSAARTGFLASTQDRGGPGSLAWALGGPAVLALALFHEVILEGRVLFQRDVHGLWYGQLVSFARAVREGAVPLWEPFTSFGSVMLANANYQVLYPTTWLALLLRPEDTISLYVLLHFLLAGVGLYRLARELGLGRDASAAAAALWLVSSPLLSAVNLWNHFGALAWTPWVVTVALRLSQRPGPGRALALAAVVAAQLLAGSPDVTLFTIALATLATLSRGGSARVAWYLGALTLAAGLSAAQWLPSLAVVGSTARAAIGLTGSTVGALHPLGGALKLLLPFGAWELPLAPPHRDLFLDGGRPLLGSLYLGAATAALVAAGCARPRPWRGALVAVGFVSFVVAMGGHTPLWSVLATVLPPVHWLRYPEKALLGMALCWSLLAGMGVEALGSAADVRARRAAAVVAGLATAASLVVALAFYRPGQWLASWLDPIAPEALAAAFAAPLAKTVTATALGAFAFALVLAARAGERPRSVAVPLLVSVAILDGFLAARDLNPAAPRLFYALRPPIADVPRPAGSRVFVWTYELDRPASGPPNPWRIAWYPPGFSLAAGRDLANRLYGTPPAGLSWSWFGSFDSDSVGLLPRESIELTARLYAAAGTPAFVRLLEVGAVAHASALHPLDAPGLRPIGSLPTPKATPVLAYAVAEPRPRAFVVSGVRVTGDADAVAALLDPAFDPRREVLLASGAPRAPVDAASTAGSARVLEWRADRVRIEAETSAPGHLVLVDAWASGWRASVDGAAAPLLRANVAFRAVPLEPGRHVVEMVYRPVAVVAGAAISAVSVLALVAAALVVGALRRRSSG